MGMLRWLFWVLIYATSPITFPLIVIPMIFWQYYHPTEQDVLNRKEYIEGRIDNGSPMPPVKEYKIKMQRRTKC
jgi:hypothetical protein